MDTSADEHHRFFEFFGSATFRKQGFIKDFFVFLICVHLIVRGNREEVDVSLLRTQGEHFLVEVELLIAVKLVQAVEEFDVSGVAVGESESEFSLVFLTSKEELEYDLQFTSLAHNQGRLRGNAGPGRPGRGRTRTIAKDWTVTFGALRLDWGLGT
jgi:hypothetical protein